MRGRPATSLLLCALATVACASTRTDGHLVSRMAAVQPARWPEPVPLGHAVGLELDLDKLSPDEAAALLPACRAAVARGLGRPVVDAAPDAPWRVVVSRLVVDVGEERRGARVTRVRAVVEVRLRDRPAAVASATAHVRNTRPTFRGDGVHPPDVSAAVAAACTRAARELASPSPVPDAASLAAWRAVLDAEPGDARVGAGARTEACRGLGSAQETVDAARVARHVEDADATTRRLCSWAAGELNAVDALDALARRAETDAAYDVRVEAVGALNKLLWVDAGLKSRIRAAREGAAAAVAGAPAAEVRDAEPGDNDDGPSRVVPLE